MLHVSRSILQVSDRFEIYTESLDTSISLCGFCTFRNYVGDFARASEVEFIGGRTINAQDVSKDSELKIFCVFSEEFIFAGLCWLYFCSIQ